MNYLDFVNVKMGTKSVYRRSYGNTLPLTQMPFGMSAFCIQTEDNNTGWFYSPEHEFCEGVRLTHQPSPWIRDYGSVLMMPQNDIISDSPKKAWSGYRIADSVQRPDYIKLTLLRSGCTLELTPTERGAAIRLEFDNDRPSYLSFFPTVGSYSYRYDSESSTLFGVTDGHSYDNAKDFKMHFAVRFPSDAVDAKRTYTTGSGNTAAIHIALNGNRLEGRIGISYISEELALSVIDRESGTLSFDELRSLSESIWEERLHRIEIQTDNEERMRTFYSCLYRAFLFPHKAYELDNEGNPIHYSPSDGSVHPGPRYTDNGFWDTARTVYPLFTLIAREEYREMLRGFIGDYLESGWLPRWISIGEMGCMPSTYIDAVIAEAATSSILNKDELNIALEAMLKHANKEAISKRNGRNGVLAYLKHGYVPCDIEHESVNLTLDAAYGDWCISRVAELLGKNELAEEYKTRALNYKNLFDPQSGFMRPRLSNGSMKEPFDPISWGGDYTEGSAWQTSFAVPHDPEGLAVLYGGKDNLIKKLDEFFSTPPKYRVTGYGTEIHEMTEMAALDFGQMAISNQPSFHIPFIYAALGAQDKTDYWVERLANEAFNSGVCGYPGDEDNGSMSAWYIFAVIGRYRLCPGKDEWISCKRLVDSVKILGERV